MQRKSIKDIEPNAYKAMLGMEQYIKNSQLPALLREMIKIRASQINRCAYCIDMHTQEALKIGETSRRIFALSAWQESLSSRRSLRRNAGGSGYHQHHARKDTARLRRSWGEGQPLIVPL